LLASPPLSLNLFHVENRSIVECEKKGAQFEWISFILSFKGYITYIFEEQGGRAKKKKHGNSPFSTPWVPEKKKLKRELFFLLY